MIGETIGNFRIVSRLGRGGMGVVWLGEQQNVGTRVAIKTLHREISEDTDHVRRFFNEARAVSKIKHAGIAKIFDVGFHAGQAYLVMEHLDGETLGLRVRRLGRLPIAKLGDVCRQIASVLDATHAAGITHRDLKPDNIFLVPDHELASRERVKVLDFGVAKLTGTLASGSPRTTGTLGTPAYMAPEQWGDASAVDWRADAYSLGCIAFELACGRPPFVVTTFADACAKHLTAAPPSVRSLVPEVPIALDQLIARLLAKAPADRPATMAEIGAAFAALDDGTAVTALPASAPPAGGAGAVGHAPTLPSGRDGEPVVTDGETVDTTMGGAAAQLAEPPRAKRRAGAIVGAAVAFAGVAAVALYVATRTPASAPAPAPADAAQVVVVAIDAAPAPPPVPVTADAAAPPPPDAAPPPDAKRRASVDRPPPRPPGEPPDELTPWQVSPVMNPIIKRAEKCGPWTDEDNYGAEFRVGFDGKVHDLVVTGPDPAIRACMERLILRARFPLSKHGIEVSQGISH